jgi:hypothetical protein
MESTPSMVEVLFRCVVGGFFFGLFCASAAGTFSILWIAGRAVYRWILR